MTRADLLTLARAVRGDWEAARVQAARALAFTDRLDDDTAQTVVAASLHHFYGAVESLDDLGKESEPVSPGGHADLGTALP